MKKLVVFYTGWTQKDSAKWVYVDSVWVRTALHLLFMRNPRIKEKTRTLNTFIKSASRKYDFSFAPKHVHSVPLFLGGVHAAMVGALHPTPIATFPFLSPHSAVVAFCEGVLQHATAWDALREDICVQKAAMTLEEVRERMRNVLSLTDVTRFPIPKNPNAVILVAATVSEILITSHTFLKHN